ncbi:hypothetical protein DFH09DRAFT_1281188 [Mycena vulgaris]|nr:hypothetical protein DFH09DRAFT_1281188 [Mycena vulgaris]
MPHQPPDILDNILQYTLVAANALQEVSSASQVAFVKSVCSLTVSIIPMIQNTKFQKARCLTMAEHIHCLLCALMALCLYSGDIGSPQILDHIGQFAETSLGLKTQHGVGVASALVDMGLDTERRHQDLLELISARSTTLTTASSIRGSSFGNRLVAFLGNIHNLLLCGLADDPDAKIDIAHSILLLNKFSREMLKGNSLLTKQVPNLIKETGDPQLRWSYASDYLRGQIPPIAKTDAEIFVVEGIQYFRMVQCPIDQAVHFYTAAAFYYGVQKRFARATEIVDLALGIGKHIKDPSSRFKVLSVKYQILQDMQEQVKLLTEARESGPFPPQLETHVTLMMAEAYTSMGNLSRGLALCGQGNELLVATGMEGSETNLHSFEIQAEIHWQKTTLALLDIALQRDEAEILRHLQGAEAVYRAFGSQRALLCSYATAELYLYRGDTETARFTLEECLSRSRGIYPDLPLRCSATLGDIQHRMYSTRDTFCWAMVYLTLAWKAKDRVATFSAIRRLAEIYKESDDEETALNLFNTALEGSTEIDIHRLRAQCIAGIGDIMMRRGDSGQARNMWEAAHPLFVRSSQVKEAAAIDARLSQLSANLKENLEQTQDATETIRKLNKLALLPSPEILPLEAGSSTRSISKSLDENQADPESMLQPVRSVAPDRVSILIESPVPAVQSAAPSLPHAPCPAFRLLPSAHSRANGTRTSCCCCQVYKAYIECGPISLTVSAARIRVHRLNSFIRHVRDGVAVLVDDTRRADYAQICGMLPIYAHLSRYYTAYFLRAPLPETEHYQPGSATA